MKFSDLTSSLPPAIARALAARGYETATGVQAAVLDGGHAGRDLLVSSQTGSGKTVAFGSALAQTLLGGETPARGQRGAPVALVVVPTRELAVQVREELAWLLAETGLRLASFTGGTAISGDLNTLQKGVDVAIGTPGRLVDLMRRERMSLGTVRVVVLDEADEMLDLGFREDLQTLLQAAPAERRTLLLSATMPPEIQAMAKRFQRDAVRVDVRRTDGASGRQSHDDITYVAHLISGADRLAVVVNVLRTAGDGRAIVFVTTRESVSRLHAALVARGFAATAISGDRAQNERDRALEQLRKGDARVLVATNVAARGLHLPDVDLIVHADLPLNAESLTHRSGRTGRAGRKGTAVVIAGLSERRKAERLLAEAHVQFTWTPPPSAETITEAARERLVETLLETGDAESAAAGEGADGAPSVEDVPDAASMKAAKAAKAAAYVARKRAAAEALLGRMESTVDARELAVRLLLRELDRLPAGERVHPVSMPGPGAGGRQDEDRGPKPGRADFNRNGAKFRVNIGAKDNADPRWLLPLICRRGGVTRHDVGAIRIGPRETEFEIAPGAAADFALAAAEPDPRAPHVMIEAADRGQARAPRQSAPSRLGPPPRQAPPPRRPAPAPAAARTSHAGPSAVVAPSPRPALAIVDKAPAKPALAVVEKASPRPTPAASAPPPSVPAKPAAAPSVAKSPAASVSSEAPKHARPKAPEIETKRARPLAPRTQATSAPARPTPANGGPADRRPGPPMFGRPNRDAHTPPRRLSPPPHKPFSRATDGSAPPRRAPRLDSASGPTGGHDRPGPPAKPSNPFWKTGARKRPPVTKPVR